MLAGVADARKLLFGLPSGQVAFAGLGQPENGVERGADLVAHVGDEVAAGAGQPFGFGAGFGPGCGEGMLDLAPLAHLEHYDVEDEEGDGADCGQEQGRDGVGR